MRARDDVVAVGKRRDPTGADAVSRRGAGQRGEQLPGLAVEEIDGAGVDDVVDILERCRHDDVAIGQCHHRRAESAADLRIRIRQQTRQCQAGRCLPRFERLTGEPAGSEGTTGRRGATMRNRPKRWQREGHD